MFSVFVKRENQIRNRTKKRNEQRKLTQLVGQPASQSRRKCEKKNKSDCDNEYIQQQRFCLAQISWTCVKIRINKSLINAKSQIKVTNQKSKAFNSKAAHRMCVWAVIVFSIKYYECMIYLVYFFFFSSIFFSRCYNSSSSSHCSSNQCTETDYYKWWCYYKMLKSPIAHKLFVIGDVQCVIHNRYAWTEHSQTSLNVQVFWMILKNIRPQIN